VDKPQLLGRTKIRRVACEGEGWRTGSDGHALEALHFERGKFTLDARTRDKYCCKNILALSYRFGGIFGGLSGFP
jgi:hypothetical protein